MKQSIRLIVILILAIFSTSTSVATEKFSQDPAIIAQIDKELWMPLMESVYEADYPLHESCYHPSAIMVLEISGKTMSGKQWLEGVKAGFEERKNQAKTTFLKMRFSKRLHDSVSGYETGIFLFSSIRDGERKNAYIKFEFLLTRENGKWQLLLENQQERLTEEDWNALDAATEIK
ncbi:MAG: nuclear transport factor 2 family protein [Bacteroidetes bacterium]|nr:nuclear transport factor 2 family protein [Bacteroidota bacterium]